MLAVQSDRHTNHGNWYHKPELLCHYCVSKNPNPNLDLRNVLYHVTTMKGISLDRITMDRDITKLNSFTQ